MSNRRNFLFGGTLLIGGAYLHSRGIRFPRLGLTPTKLDNQSTTQGVQLYFDGLIALPSESESNSRENDISLRAYKPSIALKIEGKTEAITISVNNVSPSAQLHVIEGSSVKIEESQNGINREITLTNNHADAIEIEWKTRGSEEISFAVIGDTGGNAELQWCLERAAELEADFLLHLGDFNYGNGDYDRAIHHFHNSLIPCYISIGNHDFNDSGLVYEKFRSMLGPLNNVFDIAGTRFINFDTGADFLPVHAGLRGDFFSALATEKEFNHVYYTHRPLMDPRPGEDHIVGSQSEVDWIVKMINRVGSGPLLTGHVHHSAELNVQGIKQYTVGEGLGHEDLLLRRPVAQMLLGKAINHENLELNWVPINMPWKFHLSHTHESKLKKRGDANLLAWYREKIT